MFVLPRRAALFLFITVALTACTTASAKKPNNPGPQIQQTDASTAQPATATYSCADGGMITIQNLGTSVRIQGLGDDVLELPASPQTQRSRYGEQPYALVLEGRDALFMKSGQEPLTCTR
jgi:hypothetical protein